MMPRCGHTQNEAVHGGLSKANPGRSGLQPQVISCGTRLCVQTVDIMQLPRSRCGCTPLAARQDDSIGDTRAMTAQVASIPPLHSANLLAFEPYCSSQVLRLQLLSISLDEQSVRQR